MGRILEVSLSAGAIAGIAVGAGSRRRSLRMLRLCLLQGPESLGLLASQSTPSVAASSSAKGGGSGNESGSRTACDLTKSTTRLL